MDLRPSSRQIWNLDQPTCGCLTSTHLACSVSLTRVSPSISKSATHRGCPAPLQNSSPSPWPDVLSSTPQASPRKSPSPRISSNTSRRTSAIRCPPPPITPVEKASLSRPAHRNATEARVPLAPTSSRHSKANCSSLRSSSSADTSASKSTPPRFDSISMHSFLSIPSAVWLQMGP